jgi:hypothetical protein
MALCNDALLWADPKGREYRREPEYIRDSGNDAIQHALMREDLARLRKHIAAVQKYVGTVTKAK